MIIPFPFYHICSSSAVLFVLLCCSTHKLGPENKRIRTYKSKEGVIRSFTCSFKASIVVKALGMSHLWIQAFSVLLYLGLCFHLKIRPFVAAPIVLHEQIPSLASLQTTTRSYDEKLSNYSAIQVAALQLTTLSWILAGSVRLLGSMAEQMAAETVRYARYSKGNSFYW